MTDSPRLLSHPPPGGGGGVVAPDPVEKIRSKKPACFLCKSLCFSISLSSSNCGCPPLSHPARFRLQLASSPLIWEQQGKMNKKPKRQHQQQGERYSHRDRHNEVSRVHNTPFSA